MHVLGDVFPNSGMGTATCFYPDNTVFGQGLVADKELCIFACENVIGHDRNVHFLPQGFAQLQKPGRLACAYWSADADGERPFLEISVAVYQLSLVVVSRGVPMVK